MYNMKTNDHAGYYRHVVHSYSNAVLEALGEDNVKIVDPNARRHKLFVLFFPPGTEYRPGKSRNLLKAGEYYSEEFVLPNGKTIVCTTRDTAYMASVKRGT